MKIRLGSLFEVTPLKRSRKKKPTHFEDAGGNRVRADEIWNWMSPVDVNDKDSLFLTLAKYDIDIYGDEIAFEVDGE